MASKLIEKGKVALAKATDKTNKMFDFLTAKSKKIIISLLFLTIVIVDEIWLGNKIFTANKLFDSNVFRAIVLTIAVISIKDVQTIMTTWVEKRFVGKALPKKK